MLHEALRQECRDTCLLCCRLGLALAELQLQGLKARHGLLMHFKSRPPHLSALLGPGITGSPDPVAEHAEQGLQGPHLEDWQTPASQARLLTYHEARPHQEDGAGLGEQVDERQRMGSCTASP